jgi:hypothetical protein
MVHTLSEICRKDRERRVKNRKSLRGKLMVFDYYFWLYRIQTMAIHLRAAGN